MQLLNIILQVNILAIKYYTLPFYFYVEHLLLDKDITTNVPVNKTITCVWFIMAWSIWFTDSCKQT